MNYSECIISQNHNVLEALEFLNESVPKVLFVTDDLGVLKGSITDGDIRRAILLGLNSGDNITAVMNPNPIALQKTHTKRELFIKFKDTRVMLIPIVDIEGRILDIASNVHLYDSRWQETTVVVVAGGLGKRLMPLTDKMPKPMLEVRGKPILEHSIDRLIGCGFKNFVFSVNYKASIIRDFFGNGEKFGANISYIEETHPMGTGGSLALLDPLSLSENILVMNGDVLTDLDARQMLDFHVDQGAMGTMGVRNYTMDIPYGVVEADGAIFKDLFEKPSKSFFINAGVYALKKQSLDQINANEYFDLPDLFNILTKYNQRCVIFPIKEKWRDIGSFDEFHKAQFDVN